MLQILWKNLQEYKKRGLSYLGVTDPSFYIPAKQKLFSMFKVVEKPEGVYWQNK